MPSKSKSQARFMEDLYNNPHKIKGSGFSEDEVNEWVEADRANGTHKLPNHTKTSRSKNSLNQQMKKGINNGFN